MLESALVIREWKQLQAYRARVGVEGPMDASVMVGGCIASQVTANKVLGERPQAGRMRHLRVRLDLRGDNSVSHFVES